MNGEVIRGWTRFSAAVVTTIGVLLSLYGVFQIAEYFTTDKELMAAETKVKRFSDQNYFQRRIEFAELRVDIHCSIKPSEIECDYWRKQLRKEKEKYSDFTRK